MASHFRPKEVQTSQCAISSLSLSCWTLSSRLTSTLSQYAPCAVRLTVWPMHLPLFSLLMPFCSALTNLIKIRCHSPFLHDDLNAHQCSSQGPGELPHLMVGGGGEWSQRRQRPGYPRGRAWSPQVHRHPRKRATWSQHGPWNGCCWVWWRWGSSHWELKFPRAVVETWGGHRSDFRIKKGGNEVDDLDISLRKSDSKSKREARAKSSLFCRMWKGISKGKRDRREWKLWKWVCPPGPGGKDHKWRH